MCFEGNIFSFIEPSFSAYNVINLLVFSGVSCLRVRLSPLFVILWPLPSPIEISHPKELALKGGQLPQVHSTLAFDLRFLGFMRRLSFTLFCMLEVWVALFAYRIKFSCQTVPAARTCVAPNGRNPQEGFPNARAIAKDVYYAV